MDYGPMRALDGLSLTIPQGEFFAFLGPNGAGKTTAIKLLTGLMKPLRGSVRICGFDLNVKALVVELQQGIVEGRETLLFTQELSEANRQLITVRIKRQEAEARLSEVKANPNSFTDVLASAPIQFTWVRG